MSGSSMVPSACEWLARICSSSVDPGRGKECRIKEAADARAAALEAVDVERRIEAAQLVTAGVVGEGLRVAAPLLAGPAEREIHLRLVAAIALVCRQQLLHRGDLRIAEGVVLEIGQVPVRLAATRIHLQSCLVGGLAVMAAAERLLRVTDRQTQPDLVGLEPRCVL